MPRWTTEVRNDHSVFSELAEWWDAQPVVLDNPYLTSSILECWQQGDAGPDGELHVRLLRRDGELVAGLPMYRARGRYRSLFRGFPTSFDVVTGSDPEVLKQIPLWLNEMAMAYLYRVRRDSCLISGLASHPRWQVERVLGGLSVDLSHRWEASSELPKGLLKSLRRRRRRLEEMGEVIYVDHPPADETGATLQMGLDLEAAGWKGTSGVAALTNPTEESWLRAIAKRAQDKGWLRLSSLQLDDRMIAFAYDLVYAGRRHGVIAAYDESPDVAAFSPGNLLLWSVLEHSAQEGLHRYEFGNGRQQWKYDWASDEREVYDLLIFGSGIAGGTLASMHRIWRKVPRGRSSGSSRGAEEI